MAEIWTRLLGLDRPIGIGIDDDFFELGGNSMTVIRFTGEIAALFGVELPIGFTLPGT